MPPTTPPVATITAEGQDPIKIEITLTLIDDVETALGTPLFDLIDKWQTSLSKSMGDDVEGESEQQAAERRSAAMFNAAKGFKLGEISRFVAASLKVDVESLPARLGNASLMAAFWSLLLAFQQSLLQIWGGKADDANRESGEPEAPKA